MRRDREGLAKREKRIEKRETELKKLLERASRMTVDEAKKVLLDEVQKDLKEEIAKKIRAAEEKMPC